MITMITLCDSKEETVGLGFLKIKQEYPEMKGYHDYSVGVCQADISFKEKWTE
jgi:hypothetical protein